MNAVAYRAQCVCGAWPPAGRVEASNGGPTAQRGWMVVHHSCLCGRETRFAHDTENRMPGVLAALGSVR